MLNRAVTEDELAIAVLEEMMHDLALQIEQATAGVKDPAQVYAFGNRTVLDAATTDIRWKQMLLLGGVSEEPDGEVVLEFGRPRITRPCRILHQYACLWPQHAH
ncbi:hypothetical protein ACU4GI_12545 [Cupriavidus basilensis]